MESEYCKTFTKWQSYTIWLYHSQKEEEPKEEVDKLLKDLRPRRILSSVTALSLGLGFFIYIEVSLPSHLPPQPRPPILPHNLTPQSSTIKPDLAQAPTPP